MKPLTSEKSIRILIVDDSLVIQKMLVAFFSNQPDFIIAGVCSDPFETKHYISEGLIDCIILDLEMPKMDGITFLKKVMSFSPLPIIIMSSALDNRPDLSATVLKAGAIRAYCKPKGFDHVLLSSIANDFRSSLVQRKIAKPQTQLKNVLMIASSTGGTDGVRKILSHLNTSQMSETAVFIVQHMSEKFTKTFASSLDHLSSLSVCEASNDQPVEPETAYVAPGNFHMIVKKSGPGNFKIELNQSDFVHSVRPAADVTLEAWPKEFMDKTTLVILSGMGRDGSMHLKKLRSAGVEIIAESEETCVVFGMPKAAIESGFVSKVLGIDELCKYLVTKYSSQKAA